uniref:G-protein coupled receptors family 1 profile domain-containing protein n=1 Tax=Neolamprologus brichardi TaxID=32507 RepID=A0A3Q4ICY8_NEOBR
MMVESDSDHGPECVSVCNKSATLTGQRPPVLVNAWLVPTFFGFIMLVGLVGNSLVIHVITKHQKMKTVFNFFIDTTGLKRFCCTVIVTNIPCVPGFQVTAQAPCITLSAMSVDCCYMTLYPLQSLRHRTPRRAQVGYCWFGPQTYYSDVFPSAHLQRAFTIYSFLAVYLLPLLTITACYAIMLKRMGQPSMNPIGSEFQIFLLITKTWQFSRMVVVMVSLFLICWYWKEVCILLQAFGLQSYILYKLKIWGHCMSYSNSSVNQFMYAFTGNNFRKAFKHAFPAILLWRSRGRVRVGNTDAEEEVETDHRAPKGEAEMHFLSSGP